MEPTLGSVVKFWFLPFFDHEAIVTGFDWDGMPLLTHNSQKNGRVVEERFDDVVGIRKYRVEYPSRLPPAIVAARAKQLLGREYNLLAENCRDLVRYAHDLGPAGKIATAASFAALAVGGPAAWIGGAFLVLRGLSGKPGTNRRIRGR